MSMDKSNSGEVRAFRAISWCFEETRKSAHSFHSYPSFASILLANAVHVISRSNGETREQFPSFDQDISSFPSVENLQNFLLAEQIWLETNPEEMQQYSYGLVQSLNKDDHAGSQTSAGLQQLIYQIVQDLGFGERQNLSVLDPTCGHGVLLSGLSKLLPHTSLSLHGQEINNQNNSVAQQLFKLCGVQVELRSADLLVEDAFKEHTFDLVFLDAPIGMSWNPELVNSSDDRFKFGLPPRSDASLLFIQAGLAKLKPESEGGGVLMAVTTNRNLVGDIRGNQILEGFVQDDLMQAVIALPGGMQYGTQVPLYLIVMSNAKSAKWRNKVQLIDVKTEFEDVYGGMGRNRVLSKNGLLQVQQAVTTPKPLKAARTLGEKDLWLFTSEISYPDVTVNIWNKAPSGKNARFTLAGLTNEPPAIQDFEANLANGLGSVVVNNSRTYISFQVEPRFNSAGRKFVSLDHSCTDSVSLMRLAKEVLTFSKSEAVTADLSANDYLAIPRGDSNKCIHIVKGEIPNDLHRYILVALIQRERMPSLVAWLNTGQGRLAREEIWRQLKDENRFMQGMLTPSEILQFISLLRVPYLDQVKMNQIAISEAQIEQSLNVLNSLRDEIWVDENSVEIVSEIAKAINGDSSLSKWAENLPYPLAASLRTYESNKQDPAKAADQLIHFWEASSQFMATYLLSALKKSEELWNSEIPKLNRAIETGKCSLDRATIGTWKIVLEYLSKRFLKWLESGDIDEHDRALLLLGGASQRNIEKLLNPQILILLGQVNEFRNRYDAHSGAMSKLQDQAKHNELLAITNEFKSVVGSAWNGLKLIRPIAQFNRREGTFLECELLMGPTAPFLNEEIQVQDNLIVNELYLVGESSSVPLLPFVRMGSQPKNVEDTFYFYNRKEGKGARFVSYHKSSENEITEDSDFLLQTLVEIQTLSVSPFEEHLSGEANYL